MNQHDLDKAALRGEPSYVWRAGQQRRLEMILHAAGERVRGRVLENGCGVGIYLEKLSAYGGRVIGLEFDRERAAEARTRSPHILNAAGESLPLPSSTFDLILSHEVIEHVRDDRAAIREMVRVLRSPNPASGRPGGRIVLFCPNRGYPFETHGIYWRGRYRFGNIPLVNYLPRVWRDKLAPHVRVYSKRDLEKLFADLPVRFIERTVIFGAYDNIIARFGPLGKFLRAVLQFLEKTPLRTLGLSHFWVVEKLGSLPVERSSQRRVENLNREEAKSAKKDWGARRNPLRDIQKTSRSSFLRGEKLNCTRKGDYQKLMGDECSSASESRRLFLPRKTASRSLPNPIKFNNAEPKRLRRASAVGGWMMSARIHAARLAAG